MGTPDVELVFGLQKTGTYDSIFEQLSSVINEIEKSDVTKIKFSIDTGSLKNIQTQIQNLGLQNVAKKATSGLDALQKKYKDFSLQLQNFQNQANKFKGITEPESGNVSYNDTLQTISAMQQQYAIATNLNKTDIERISAYEKLAPLQKTYTEQVKNLNLQQQAVNKNDSTKIAKQKTENSLIGEQQNAIAKLTNTYAEYGKKIEKNDSLSEQYYNTLKKLNQPLGSANGFKDVSEIRAEMGQWNKSAAEAGIKIDTLDQKLKKLFATHLDTAVVMYGINMLQQGLQQVLQNVVELDQAVVNLSMVTGYNRDQTKALISTYSEMAQALGATTSEVANSANEWLRQGYSLEDTNKLIETSTVLSKIGMLSTTEATQYLTSAIKGYKISIEDAMSVADKFSAVDMSAAVSVSGLAEAMSKTANSARLAGVDINTLLGELAAVGEVTQQDMASVGNAFKTMFARYSNVKLGKLEDDDGESLNDYETILNRVGIKLRDTAGTFRDFDVVLDEVEGKWASLSQVEQSAIATALGATRQKENVLTLMENYGNAMEYAETAVNSTGTAIQKYEAYSQGIEASSKRFQASFESFSTTLLNSDLVSGVISLGSTLMNLLTIGDAIIAKIGAIIGVIAVLNKLNVGAKIGHLVTRIITLTTATKASAVVSSGWYTTLKDIGTSGVGGLLTALPKLILVLASRFFPALKNGTLSLQTFKGALTAVEVSPIMIALSALTYIISGIVIATQMANQATEEARQKSQEAAQSFNEEKSSLEEKKQKLIELRQELDAGNLSQEEAYNKQKELLSIQQELID